MQEEIGTTAGAIWQVLTSNGELSLKQWAPRKLACSPLRPRPSFVAAILPSAPFELSIFSPAQRQKASAVLSVPFVHLAQD